MIDLHNPDNAPSAPQSTQGDGPTHEEILATTLPPQETEQPDPALQFSVGRVGPGSITLVAIVGAIILGVVFYGLNSPAPNSPAPSSPPVPAAPAAGGTAGSAAPGGQHAGNAGHN